MKEFSTITREHILQAIQKIRKEGVPNHAQSSTYDVLYEGERFPPKLVVSYANVFANGEELDRNNFSGGKESKCFKLLENRGFQIVDKKKKVVVDQEKSFSSDLKKFLAQSQAGELSTKGYRKSFQGLKVKVSFGQGGFARIPWISFLYEGQTTSQGIYPVYLYYKKYQKLVLAYGVSETYLAHQQWAVPKEAVTINTYFEKFDIVPERYGESYVFKVYDTSQKLDYESMEDDLLQIIGEYKQLMEGGPMKKNENKEFKIELLKTALLQTGLLFEDKLLNRFVTALLAKPFVILTGLAGSGKTKLAQVFAQWICEKKEQVCMVPVGADWTNREPLLGYPNALSEGEYVMPENGALELLIQAGKEENRNKPYFLILDEMNLSHVERYFADFLSVMESQEAIPLHPDTEIWKKCRVPAKISLPSNLFIIGTVNIDETTYMFSPKVLDRANVIEFRVTAREMEQFLKYKVPVDLKKIQGEGAVMGESFVEMAVHKVLQPKESEKLNETLLHFFSRLKNAGAEFGFRSANEICTFVAIADRLVPAWTEDEVIDAAIMQKLLPKLHGSQRKLEGILRTLGELCLNEGQNVEDYFVKDKPIAGVKYPLSLDKLARMYKGVVNNGFVSYAEA